MRPVWHGFQSPLAEEPLFSFGGGRPINRSTIGETFRSLIPQLELRVPEGISPPRLHEMLTGVSTFAYNLKTRANNRIKPILYWKGNISCSGFSGFFPSGGIGREYAFPGLKTAALRDPVLQNGAAVSPVKTPPGRCRSSAPRWNGRNGKIFI